MFSPCASYGSLCAFQPSFDWNQEWLELQRSTEQRIKDAWVYATETRINETVRSLAPSKTEAEKRLGSHFDTDLKTYSVEWLQALNNWRLLFKPNGTLISKSALDSLKIEKVWKCAANPQSKSIPIFKLANMDSRINAKSKPSQMEPCGKRHPIRKLWRALNAANVNRHTGVIGFEYRNTSGAMVPIDGLAPRAIEIATRILNDDSSVRRWKYKQRGFKQGVALRNREQMPSHDTKGKRGVLSNGQRRVKNVTKAESISATNAQLSAPVTAQQLDDAESAYQARMDSKLIHSEGVRVAEPSDDIAQSFAVVRKGAKPQNPFTKVESMRKATRREPHTTESNRRFKRHGTLSLKDS